MSQFNKKVVAFLALFSIVSSQASAEAPVECSTITPQISEPFTDCSVADLSYFLGGTLKACKIKQLQAGEVVTIAEPKEHDQASVCLYKSIDENVVKTLIGFDGPVSATKVIIKSQYDSDTRTDLTFTNRLGRANWLSFSSSKVNANDEDRRKYKLLDVSEFVDTKIALYVDDIVSKINIIKHSLQNLDGKDLGKISLEKTEDGKSFLSLSFETEKLNGPITVEIENEYEEVIVLEISVERGYFISDRTLAKKATELALLYKLQADETFLRASAQCVDATQDKVHVENCDPFKTAAKLYKKAEDSIPDCLNRNIGDEPELDESCNSEDLTTTWNLLRSDIKYRQKLLEFGLPFYGGFRTLTPTTPHQELVKMNALLEDMTDLIARIDILRQRYEDEKLNEALIEAEKVYALGQYDTSEIDQRIGQIQADFATLDLDSYEERETQLFREISEFQNELDRISSEQEALGKQAAALTQAGIAAATGVPIADVEAIASGDLKKVAKSFVENQVLAPNAPLGKEILASSEIARGVAETVGNVKKAVNKLKGFEEQKEVVEKAIRGDREAIRKLVNKYGNDDTQAFLEKAEELEGQVKLAVALSKSFDRNRAIEFLKSNLPEEQRKEIDELVEQIKPVERLLEAAYVGVMQGNFDEVLLREFETALRSVVVQATPDENEMKRMRMELKSIARQDPSKFIDPYFQSQFIGWRRQAEELLDALDGEIQSAVSAVVKFDAKIILEHPKVRARVENLSATRRAKLIEGISTLNDTLDAEVKKVFNYKIETKEICVKNGLQASCVSFAEIKEQIVSEYGRIVSDFHGVTAIPIDRVNKFIEQEIDQMPDELVILLYLAKDGSGGFSGNIAKLFEGDEVGLQNAWEKIPRTGELFGDPVVTQAGHVAVAELITASQMPQPKALLDANKPIPSSGGVSSSSQGGPDPLTNAAIQTALNAALPGAGIAFQLGQTWASMDANRGLQEDYTKRISSAVQEQDNLARSKQQAIRASSLAGLHQDRSIAIRRAGEQQISQFEVALAATMDAKEFNRELISLYRPRFYFIAEALRERFDAFDRSLSDWTVGTSSNGFFKEMILNDPRNIRFALDSEIQLFGWLNRNIEATRTGPYTLHNHWEQLVLLAREYCADFGCKPGDGLLGQIGHTVPLSFFENIEGKLAKGEFRKWKNERNKTDTFKKSFSFVRGQLGLPSNALNARLLDIVVVPIDQASNPLLGSRVNLTHNGISTLVLEQFDEEQGLLTREVQQTLLPRQLLAPNRSEPEDIELLRNRFQTQNSVSSLLRLRDLEGYGLYGNFTFEVLPGPGVDLIDDFVFQVHYIYTNSSNLASEIDFYSNLERENCFQGNGPENPLDTLTGVFCNSTAAIVEYKPLIAIDGKLECKDETLAKLRLTDEEQTDHFRKRGGIKCLTIKPDPENRSPEKPNLVLDVGLKAASGDCQFNEILLLAAFDRAESKCFGDVN